MADKAEESPLLCAETSEAELYTSVTSEHVPSAPPYQGEAPPPYWAVPVVGSASLCCGVCGAQIALNSNSSQYIVKCGVCQEATAPRSGGKQRVRCPHCREVSFIGQHYPMKRCIYSSLLAIFFAIIAGGLIAATVDEARDYNAIYAVWTFLLMLCVSCVCVAVYWARGKISTPQQS